MNKRGEIIYGTDNIIKTQVDFYTDLYKREGIDEGMAQKFLRVLQPQISDESRKQLDESINLSDFTKAFKKMKNNKSPGPDGLPIEFFIRSASNSLKHFQTPSNTFEKLRISSNSFEHLQTVRTPSNSFEQLQNTSKNFKQLRAASNNFEQHRTASNTFKHLRNALTSFEQLRTTSSS